MTRKERRARQYEREQLGLPPAKPWEHAKAERRLRVSKLIELQDQQLAKTIGVPVEVVKSIRKSVTTRSEAAISVVQSQ
jgi:hypothetical protein